jgi:formylglycine-generating enzyme required for sulfatase activity
MKIKNPLLSSFPWIIWIGVFMSGCQINPEGSGQTPILNTESETATPKAGNSRMDAKGIAQVWVEAGSFRMGSGTEEIDALLKLNPPAVVAAEFASEQPQHEVRIAKGFWIDKTEVTNRAFRAFVDDGGYTNRAYWSAEGWKWLQGQLADMLPMYCLGNAEENPVACVTWHEAEAYAAWRGGRLPTEAEWEYAARGPVSNVYPWGNVFDPGLCNVVDSKSPLPVGSFPGGASWVGALDMAGNVMEWVQDWLGPYGPQMLTDPAGPEAGRVKVEKGGWWGSNLFAARAAYRHFEDPPAYQDAHIGFRIVTTSS